MSDELTELLDAAIYKEIASQAFYIGAQRKTQDAGAITLMQELAAEELRHSQWLKSLKEKGWKKHDWHQEKVPNLMISEYLTSVDTLESAGLQDTLVAAMQREQRSVEFYSRMMSVMKKKSAKNLSKRLVNEELKHKLKLEIFYDDLFYGEN
jgi:rubrerythrin